VWREMHPVALGDGCENDLCLCDGEAVTDANTGAAAERQIGEAMAQGDRRRGEPCGLERPPCRPSATWLRSVRCHPAFARDVQLPTSWTPPGRDRRPRLRSYAAPRAPRWARVCTRGAQGLARH